MKVVLDTNILWVSISRQSKSHWVLEELINGTFTLCVTTDILAEYEEIINRRLGFETSQTVLKLIDNLPNVEYITRYFRWEMIVQDYDDNKFVDCAIAGNAHYLATNDRHFNILKTISFPKVNIVDLKGFKSIVDSIKR